MFIIDWLAHQLYLTWQQILLDITIPHLITGSIFYVIVHRATKQTLKKAAQLDQKVKKIEHETGKAFKSHAQKLIKRHVWDRHGGHPLTCQHDDCLELAVVTDPTPR